jgi:hypothetical protein
MVNEAVSKHVSNTPILDRRPQSPTGSFFLCGSDIRIEYSEEKVIVTASVHPEARNETTAVMSLQHMLEKSTRKRRLGKISASVEDRFIDVAMSRTATVLGIHR